ncbi:MAG: 2-isopropylmalate synthase [Sandaracinaceae bacterium]
MTESRSETPFDWAEVTGPRPTPNPAYELHDETLRDGVQCPSALDPDIDSKIRMLHLLSDAGVDSVNIGLPGAGPRPFEDAIRLAREIVDHKLPIKPTAAARTVVADIAPIAELVQQVGIPVEVMTFIGSSPIRQYTEDWTYELICSRSREAIAFAVKEGLPVTFVTEDTTRSAPAMLEPLFRAAIHEGARSLALCDTVGHATPDGVRNLIRFARYVIATCGAEVAIDWHGHNDRGFALENALVAIDAGADRVHGCVLGIGERVGNTSLEMLMLNLALDGRLGNRSIAPLAELCRIASESMRMPLSADHPLTGPHADAWLRQT